MMTYEIIKTIGTMDENFPAPVRTWKKTPSDFNAACYAARHYAKVIGNDIAIIPGNSYGAMVYHVVSVTQNFAKFRPGCMDGIGAIISPRSNLVRKAKFN